MIPPPRVRKTLNLLEPYNKNKPWKHQGTHGEALAVESIYGLKKVKKSKRRRKKRGMVIK